MSDLMKMHREMEPSPSAKGPVLVAGDPERIHMKETDEQGGIKVTILIIILLLRYFSTTNKSWNITTSSRKILALKKYLLILQNNVKYY